MTDRRFECECGKEISYYNRKVHYKSKLHRKYEENGIKYKPSNLLIEEMKEDLEKCEIKEIGRPVSVKETKNTYNPEVYKKKSQKQISASTKYNQNHKETYNSYHKNYYESNPEYRERKKLQSRLNYRKKMELKKNLI